MAIYGNEILCFDTVTSTFDKLFEYPFKDGLVVLAKSQTNGQGRSGRRWESDSGGIYFSFYIKPKEDVREMPFIAIVCALASHRTLSKYVPCKIKWPNDIVADGKKICGILIKSVFQGDSSYVAAGVGINANNMDFGELDYRADSLKNLLGEEVDSDIILKEFFSNFEHVYLNLTKEEILKEYIDSCITVGSEVALHYNSDSEPVRGRCVGVFDDGSLVVETAEGKVNVNYGEVSVRGVYGYV